MNIEAGPVSILKYSSYSEHVEQALRAYSKPVEDYITRTVSICRSRFDYQEGVAIALMGSTENSEAPCSGYGYFEFGDPDDFIVIVFYPRSPGFTQSSKAVLPGVVAHELAHWVRRKKLGIRNNSLGDCITEEGVATYCEKKIFPRISLLRTDFTEGEMKLIVEAGKKDWGLIAEERDYQNRWMFGKQDLPPSAVYALGLSLVNRYANLIRIDVPEVLSLKRTHLESCLNLTMY